MNFDSLRLLRCTGLLLVVVVFFAVLVSTAVAKFRPTQTPVALAIINSETVKGTSSPQTLLETDKGDFLVDGDAALVGYSDAYRLDVAMEDGSQHTVFVCDRRFVECFLVRGITQE